ncbi:MAG: N-6 DNA methylase [Planctomycetota bacterium JB042]
MPSPPLRAATLDYLARTPLAKRKALGQFFTPAALRDALLRDLEVAPGERVLDPACGTGEFLVDAAGRFPGAEIVGWEIDDEPAAVAARAVPGATVEVRDALEAPFAPGFDLVIGNPPYFERRLDPATRARFASAISGRPNSYALFVLLGLELLRDGGRLAFVLPPSMNNGRYFERLRTHLLSVARVERLELPHAPDLFDGASQRVMLLRLVKGERDDGRHVFRRGAFTLLCDDPAALARPFEGATTLADLGYTVRTGSVVWNQVKGDLVDGGDGAVRLIWSHDIRDGALSFAGRPGKPGFVRGKAPLVGPAIVCNRVTGSGRNARLRVALVPSGIEFVGENHVNVALPPPGTPEREVRRVVERLAEPRALAAVRRLTGNTQISSRELLHLVPF